MSYGRFVSKKLYNNEISIKECGLVLVQVAQDKDNSILNFEHEVKDSKYASSIQSF